MILCLALFYALFFTHNCMKNRVLRPQSPNAHNGGLIIQFSFDSSFNIQPNMADKRKADCKDGGRATKHPKNCKFIVSSAPPQFFIWISINFDNMKHSIKVCM